MLSLDAIIALSGYFFFFCYHRVKFANLPATHEAKYANKDLQIIKDMFPSFTWTVPLILCYSVKEHIVPETILFFRSACHLQGEYSALGTSVALPVFTTCVGPILFVFR